MLHTRISPWHLRGPARNALAGFAVSGTWAIRQWILLRWWWWWRWCEGDEKCREAASSLGISKRWASQSGSVNFLHQTPRWVSALRSQSLPAAFRPGRCGLLSSALAFVTSQNLTQDFPGPLQRYQKGPQPSPVLVLNRWDCDSLKSQPWVCKNPIAWASPLPTSLLGFLGNSLGCALLVGVTASRCAFSSGEGEAGMRFLLDKDLHSSVWVGLAEKQISADGKLGRLTECPGLPRHSVGFSRFTGALLQHDFSLWAPAKDVRLAESTRSTACALCHSEHRPRKGPTG